MTATAANFARAINDYSLGRMTAAAYGPTVVVWNIHRSGADMSGEQSFITHNPDGTPASYNGNWFIPGFSNTQIAEVNSGLAYYNFDNRSWEVIGDLSSGSNVDYTNLSIETVRNSTLAVSPGKAAIFDFTPNWDDRDEVRANGNDTIGRPTDFAGFPDADQFEATGSQFLDMSKYITGPFLCEKIVVEISGAFGTPPTVEPTLATIGAVPTVGTDDWDLLFDATVNPITFMLLNQFNTELDDKVINSAETSYVDYYPGGGLDDVVHTELSFFPVKKRKDIVWSSRYASFSTNVSAGTGSSTHSPAGLASDLVSLKQDTPTWFKAAETWIPLDFTYTDGVMDLSQGAHAFTGTVRFEEACRTIPAAPQSNPPTPNRAGPNQPANTFKRACPLFGQDSGGRSLYSLSSGRSYTRSVVGSRVVKEQDYGIDVGPTFENYLLPVYEASETSSPYLLMPTDKLIFAVANQRYPNCNTGDTTFATGSRGYTLEGPLTSQNIVSTHHGERALHNVDGTSVTPDLWSMTFTPGCTAKITFFGTQIREGRPVDVQLNQPLTSDAIHEDVRDDLSPYGEALCLDQFDVEPLSSFYGGYLDNVISGKMGIPFVASEGYMSGSSAGSSASTAFNYPDKLLSAAPSLGTYPSGTISLSNGRDARQVVASTVEGTSGVTGSLERFVTVVDTNETFYDSTAPNLQGIVDLYGIYQTATYNFVGTTAPAVVLSGRPFTSTPTFNDATDGSRKWPASSVFENGVSNLRRYPTLQGMTKPAGAQASIFDLIAYETSGTLALPYSKWGAGGTLEQLALAHVVNTTTTNYTLYSQEVIVKAFFGFGDFYGLPLELQSAPAFNQAHVGTMKLLLRGFKYGLLNAVPTPTTARFRYDTFGQFRDMLEQRPQARFFTDGRLGESTISVTFMGRDGDVGCGSVQHKFSKSFTLRDSFSTLL